MILHRRAITKLPVLAALAAVLLVLPGCPLSPDKGDDKNPDTRLTDPTTVDNTIRRLTQIWITKNLTEYDALLHSGFTFWVRDDDAGEFPWAPGDFWGRTTEIDLAENMFDEGFSGAELPIQEIKWDFTIIGSRTTLDADRVEVIEVTVDALIEVFTGTNDGFRSDTRFHFDVLPNPDRPEWFQIKRQAEIRKL